MQCRTTVVLYSVQACSDETGLDWRVEKGERRGRSGERRGRPGEIGECGICSMAEQKARIGPVLLKT